ncbi:hypothetical protein JL720_12963 [Aureococcus anophagefferens]|nr:hypothetical protein JL720_12963 [Aureococcus anophagefferens]
MALARGRVALCLGVVVAAFLSAPTFAIWRLAFLNAKPAWRKDDDAAEGGMENDVNARLTLLVDAWPYFPCVGGGRGGELVAWSAPGYAPLGAKRFDGLGHAAEDVIKEYIRAMRSAMNGGGGVARRGAHLFGENVSRTGAYLRDVRGIADGYAPSLYCHARDSVVWSEAFLATLKPYERLKLHTRVDKKLIPFYVDRFPTGAALFRDHFECFLVPDLDEWFGFHTLPSRHAADVGVESLLAPVRDRLEELVVEITNRRDGLRSVGGDSFRDVTNAVDAHRQTLAALNATVQAMDADLGAVETRVDEAFAWPAIAEAYHAVDRGSFVGTCGTADRPPKLRVAIHRCSNFVVLARYLSFGVFRGVPSAELARDVANATAVAAAARRGPRPRVDGL